MNTCHTLCMYCLPAGQASVIELVTVSLSSVFGTGFPTDRSGIRLPVSDNFELDSVLLTKLSISPKGTTERGRIEANGSEEDFGLGFGETLIDGEDACPFPLTECCLRPLIGEAVKLVILCLLLDGDSCGGLE
jgi:hypothetical protein